MKRLLSIIMLIVCVLAKADAQYYSVNYDKQTVAAISWLICRKAMSENVRVLFVTTLSNCIHRFLVSSHIFTR